MPVYPVVDLPFSFALDTVMLAWTVPTAAVLSGADRFSRGARDDG